MTTETNLKRRKALLRLGHTCSNACFFCHSLGSTAVRFDLDTDECRRRIRRVAEAGAEMVVFSGGEPTLRKDILVLCRYAGERGLESGLITNGRMLCYGDFTQKLFDAGVRYVLVSLHGDNENVHNRHTRSPAFLQTVSGIAAVSQYPVQLVVNTVLTRFNADRLGRIIELIGRFAPLRYKISLPEPRGALLTHFDEALRPDAAARAAAEFLAAADLPPGVAVGLDGFTPCLIKDYFLLNDDLFTHGFAIVWYPDEKTFFLPDRGDRSYAASCVFCSYYGLCPGLYTNYLSAYPELCLAPLCRPVSNSIRFEPRSSHPNESDPCKALFMSVPDPARWLALRDNGEIRMFATREAETDTPELLRIKAGLEQVYRVEPENGQSFDFPARLKKMSLDKPCRACAGRGACPGIFTVSGADPFKKALDGVRRLLDTARGRVCEVGCGEGPLFGYFQERLRRGEISLYVGIDPTLPASRRKTRGNFILRNMSFEDFRWDGEAFDYVVMFRVYHHLRDLERGMKVLDSITAPGSVVIITEDMKHIELFANEALKEEKTMAFHHYRNHTAPDAMRLLELWGFRKVEITPVTRRSACHWVLVAEKGASRGEKPCPAEAGGVDRAGISIPHME